MNKIKWIIFIGFVLSFVGLKTTIDACAYLYTIPFYIVILYLFYTYHIIVMKEKANNDI